MQTPYAQGGFALITGAVLLIVLTLIAITGMKTTSLEMRMSSNEISRLEAFAASEAPRVATADLLDVHTFNRGWPASIKGQVPNNIFDYTMPAGVTIRDKDDDGVPDPLYIGNDESSYSPTSMTPDAVYTRSIAVDGQTPLRQNADLAVYKLRTALAPGAGAAMVAGYEGVGRAAAASGGNVYYRILSRGVNDTATWNDAVAQWSDRGSASCTACEYRAVIRN